MAQIDNRQMVELLSGHLARRNEPQFSLGNVISTYCGIPQVRCFIPFSACHAAAAPKDFASNLYFTRYGSGVLDYENLIPYGEAIINAGSCGWSPGSDHASFKIQGATGITVGAWVKFNAVNTGTAQAIISKYEAAPLGRSYMLYESGGYAVFVISSDGGGVNVDTVTSTNAITANEWTFIVGRWYTDTTDVWVDNTKTSAASAQGAIYNSTKYLSIMSNHNGPYLTEGKVSMAFVSSRNVSDSIIGNLWQQSRCMFSQ